MRKIVLLVFLLVVTFLPLPSTIHHLSSLIPCLYGVPHIDGKNPGPKEYVHQIPDITELQRARLSPSAIAKTIGATGTKKVAVILVNFATAGTNTSEANAMTSSDITGFNTTFNYLKNFYKEASYGKLDLEFIFFYSGGSTATLTGTESPFTLSTSMSTYGADSDASLSQLVKDALNAVGGAVSSATYSGVMVAHAGYGNESTDDKNHTYRGDIWSCYIGPFTSTHGFTEGTIIPAKEAGSMSPIGVTCHEFGHHIGLWDLYKTNVSGGSSQVGCWSLMDHGCWLGDPAGSKPAHPCGWDKYKLGWLTPIEISSAIHNLTANAFETSADTIYKLKAIDSVDEYFLVYHTSHTAYLPATPGNGLLIWHIDEGTIDGVSFKSRKDNNSLNNYSHRTVDVEEADSTDPSVSPYGDLTDLWPGTRINFTPTYSNKYDGIQSMVYVLNISNYVHLSSFTVSYKPFIDGYVRDSAGSGISNVGLYLTSTSTSATVVTDSNGYFLFSDLDDGNYTITPSKTNYSFFPTDKNTILSGYYSRNNNFTGLALTTYDNLNNKPNNIKVVNNVFTPGATDGKTTIYYKTTNGGKVTIKLYTLDGRFIKTLLDENVSSGIGLVDWDGYNDDNFAVASGIYLVQIITPDYREIKKICVVH